VPLEFTKVQSQFRVRESRPLHQDLMVY
jgi:hypothetical protein